MVHSTEKCILAKASGERLTRRFHKFVEGVKRNGKKMYYPFSG